MIRMTCDRCGREQNPVDFQHFEVPCHIAEPRGHGYIDRELNPVSGRLVAFDLCNACSNLVYTAAFRVINEEKEKEHRAGDR